MRGFYYRRLGGNVHDLQLSIELFMSIRVLIFETGIHKL